MRHSSLILIAYSVVLFLTSHGSGLFSDLQVNGDLAQHTVWVGRDAASRQLVAHDVTTQFSRLIQPVGVRVIYEAASLIADPAAISKALSLVLILLAVFGVYRLLADVSAFARALGLVLVTTSSPFLVSFSGGHARGFFFVLVIWCCVALGRRSHCSAAALLLISAAFYPPALLINAGLCLVFLFRIAGAKDDRIAGPLVYFGIAFALGAGIAAVQARMIQRSELGGTMYSKTEVLHMPEFSHAGRIRLEPQLTRSFTTYVRSALHVPLLSDLPVSSNREPTIATWNRRAEFLTSLALLALWLLTVWRHRSVTQLDMLIMALLLTAVSLFGLARVMAPTLYIPDRYLVVLCLVLPLIAVRLVSTMHDRPTASFVYVLAAVTPWFLYSTSATQLTDFSALRPVYQAVGDLRQPSLIASLPELCDQIPLFTRQPCLVSFETSHAVYFRRYWSEMSARTYALLEAYFATTRQPITDLARDYGVDYILVDKESFDEPFDHFEPFTTHVANLRSGLSVEDYFLNRLESNQVLNIDGRFYLVDIRTVGD